MAKTTIKAQMKQRRDTKANWASANPVLLDGELGIVSDDPNLYKVGDGSTAWNSLPFRGFDGTLAQELGTSENAAISQKVVSEKLTALESETRVVQGNAFNHDKGAWKFSRTNLRPVSADIIIDYLGKTECNITVNGEPNAFYIVANNVATGNEMRLATVTTDTAMPYTFANPRPDLELINLRMTSISTTDTTQHYDVEITKANPLAIFGETDSQLKDSILDIQSEIGFSQDVTVTSAEISFNFTKGERYSVTNNNDSSKTVSIVSVKGASDRNNVLNLNAGQTQIFVADIDAACFRCAQNGNFTITKIGLIVDVKDLGEKISEIENNATTLEGKVEAEKDKLFNYDNIGEVDYQKDITVAISAGVVILDYLGKTDCDFVIDGTPNNAILTGVNKATGNEMHLAEISTEDSFPLTIVNPRPDLELTPIRIIGKSTATQTPLTVTIKKNSKVASEINTLNETLFNFDKGKNVIFEKRVVVKPSSSVVVLDYLGKTDCDIEIKGVSNNFILRAFVKDLDKVVELGRYTTDDEMPIVISNPRYYQELGQISIYGFSTAIKTSLDITIRKKHAILDRMKNPPLVKFDFTHELKDMSAIIAKFRPYELDVSQSWRTMPEQIYGAFDELVTLYPAYVSKVDIVEELGMTYPDYAKLGGVATDTYAATPTYKTYMYKLSCSDDTANGVEQTAKLKILIVAGVHGNEIFAPINAYNLAKGLCEASDINLFKMRGAFDVYIIPCANTYGMYHYNQGIIHSARCNANDVNINRNFPVNNWTLSGEGTQDYTGASAGSEFETQLIMNALESISPNLYIDHHNYGAESQMQYFCTVNKGEYFRMNYQSYMDCNIAFTKGLPAYFGNQFIQVKASGLTNTSPSTSGTTNRWCYENNAADFSATLEIANVINYKNGAILDKNVGEDLYGADALSVGEYTLRNILMRFSEYVMEVLSAKNGFPFYEK